MEVLHQTGHNFIWNFDSYQKDKTGNGLILSPINIPIERLESIDISIKKQSYFDPQLYLPKELRSKLKEYDFFPANLKDGFQTMDFEEYSDIIAKRNIDFQLENDFKAIVIPMRFFEVIQDDYYEQLIDYFIEPHIRYFHSLDIDKDVIMTLIVKHDQLMNDEKRIELLNWVTSLKGISGIYLIFDNNFPDKQIKDSGYIFNALLFIHALKLNELRVHIGYTNTEGLLYSVANPDSISMGSYENLRQFGIDRFREEKKIKSSPNPRLYSGKLYQWIDRNYIGGIQKLYKNWEEIFEDSKYKPLMFEAEFNWHFNRPELYKHFFLIFSQQVASLPSNIQERFQYLEKSLEEALEVFNEIEKSKVRLDRDSDGSHLNLWLTSLNAFKKYLEDNEYEF